MNQAIKLVYQKRKVNERNPRTLNKVRQMLNKNIAMKQRKDVTENQSRAEKMRKLISAVSNSPNRRRVMSNLKNRPNNTIENGTTLPNPRIKSANRKQRDRTIDPALKKRLNNNIDRMIRNKNSSNSIVAQVSHKNNNNGFVVPNEKPTGNLKLNFNQKKRSMSRYTPSKLGGNGHPHSFVAETENDNRNCLSDFESNTSSNLSIINAKAKQKYLKPLDETIELSKFRNKRVLNLELKKDDSMRKDKVFSRMPKSSANVNDSSNDSKRFISKKKIKISKKRNNAEKNKDASYGKDNSMCKVFSNDSDNSYQTIFGIKSHMDESDTLTNLKDKSALLSNLECIVEENKVRDSKNNDNNLKNKNIQN